MQNTKQKDKKRNLLDRLRRKKRVVVINEETLEERFSLNLTASQILIWTCFLGFLFCGLILSLVAFTPLREFIPGYTDVEVKEKATYAAFKVDSLERELEIRAKYIENLNNIIGGEDLDEAYMPVDDNAIVEPKPKPKIEVLSNGQKNPQGLYRSLYLAPLHGLVSSVFDIHKEHFGVDIIAPKNEVIKATSAGTVILATWTLETGYVIQIQHDNDLISVYKHNSILLKDVGERVQLGDAIAVIGDSGELTSGPHLHFELWHKGRPIDPQDLMVF
ncbi:MAG: M23 family metallopeptidase [Flavobacteriales bacterium]|nr:M23 family metallopeptidase [Flavobacteriales bacterium]